MKALLFSGNEKVQDGMQYVENTREETLFINIKMKLDYAVTRFKERSMPTAMCIIIQHSSFVFSRLLQAQLKARSDLKDSLVRVS